MPGEKVKQPSSLLKVLKTARNDCLWVECADPYYGAHVDTWEEVSITCCCILEQYVWKKPQKAHLQSISFSMIDFLSPSKVLEVRNVLANLGYSKSLSIFFFFFLSQQRFSFIFHFSI